MIENNYNIGEQPDSTTVHAVATGFDEGSELMSGSPIGKFKDSASLLDAYNELQSEFTRKCQRLSDAEKKLQELATEQPAQQTQEKVNLEEFACNKNLSEFLQSHKMASAYVEEITNEIIEDQSLRELDDGLEKAYARVLEKKYIPHEELADNQEFLDKFIYSNDKIKNKIINEYVSTLQNNQNPITIANNGFSRSVANSGKFESLEDARKYVENMFKF